MSTTTNSLETSKINQKINKTLLLSTVQYSNGYQIIKLRTLAWICNFCVIHMISYATTNKQIWLNILDFSACFKPVINYFVQRTFQSLIYAFLKLHCCVLVALCERKRFFSLCDVLWCSVIFYFGLSFVWAHIQYCRKFQTIIEMQTISIPDKNKAVYE